MFVNAISVGGRSRYGVSRIKSWKWIALTKFTVPASMVLNSPMKHTTTTDAAVAENAIIIIVVGNPALGNFQIVAG
eukprot:m.31167 g.31167  ORF g.31167 m.31167 type:complete len:76 (+) comp13955_c0_seq2:1548-1775(+)